MSTDFQAYSSTHYVDAACASLMQCKVFGTSRTISILYEVLKPGTQLEFEISVQKTQFSEEELLQITNTFYTKVFDAEKRWLEQHNLPVPTLPLEGGTYILRVGQGVSSFSTSLMILAEELGIEEKYLRSWRVTKYGREPKTRKLLIEDDQMLVPMGWAKISMG